MLLFDPTPGQLIDRISILVLKKKAAINKGRPVEALLQELTRCHEVLTEKEKLIQRDQEKEILYQKLYQDLSNRIGVQWEYENHVRECIKELKAVDTLEALTQAADLFIDCYQGNDDRARLVKEIDKLFGFEAEEKFFS